MQPAKKNKNLTSTIRVISPGLLSKFKISEYSGSQINEDSSWANNIMKILNEKEWLTSYFPINAIMAVTRNEKSEKLYVKQATKIKHIIE